MFFRISPGALSATVCKNRHVTVGTDEYHFAKVRHVRAFLTDARIGNTGAIEIGRG